MPAHDPAQRSYVSQIAARKRWGTDDTQARQALKSSRAEDYVRKLVDEAPPLTPEQRDRLALLLRGPCQPAPVGADTRRSAADVASSSPA